MRDSLLGIVTALPAERSWILGRVARPAVRIEVCGVGERRAGEAAGRLLAAGVTGLVSWGSAAGLDPTLRAGTVVLPLRVLGSGGATFEVDHGWHRRLWQRLPGKIPRATAPLAQSARLLADPAAKAELRRSSGAAAADMESATVAEAAASHGVPFLVVRVVLDAAGTSLPTALTRGAGEAGRPLGPHVAWTMLRSPGDWSDLLPLVRAYLAARRSMRQVWRRGAPGLCLNDVISESAVPPAHRVARGGGEP